jgi:hypothetical protein
MSKVKKKKNEKGKMKKEYRISNKECRRKRRKKNEEGKKKNEYRKMVRRRRGFFSQQSIMMPRHHPAPMKTDTNELAQHIGSPRRGARRAPSFDIRSSLFDIRYSSFSLPSTFGVPFE